MKPEESYNFQGLLDKTPGEHYIKVIILKKERTVNFRGKSTVLSAVSFALHSIPLGETTLTCSLLLAQLLLLINGRSLSQNRWMKIRASTIFTHAVLTG